MLIALTVLFAGICAGLMYDTVNRAILLILTITGLFVAWLIFSEIDIFSYFVLIGDIIALITGYVIGRYFLDRAKGH